MKMSPLFLEGSTLGDKHKQFNQKVNEAFRNNVSVNEIQQQYGDSELEQFFKVDNLFVITRYLSQIIYRRWAPL